MNTLIVLKALAVGPTSFPAQKSVWYHASNTEMSLNPGAAT